MQQVIWTPRCRAQAKRERLSEAEMQAIEETLAANPLAGNLVAGTGGMRKLRHPGRGKGKSGGYRTIHYYGGAGMPVLVLSVYSKGTKADLSQAERNQLAKTLLRIRDAYRVNTEETGNERQLRERTGAERGGGARHR